MTAAIPHEEPSFVVWAVHHRIKLGVAGAIVHLISWTLPHHSWPGVALTVLAGVLIGGFVFGVGYSFTHLGLCCGYCMDRITPDGAGEAAQRGRALRLAHRERQGVELAVFACLFFFSPLVATLTGLPWLALLSPLISPWLAWAMWVEKVHSRLQPWCPQCRRRGGGDDRDVSPSPMPVPEGVAS